MKLKQDLFYWTLLFLFVSLPTHADGINYFKNKFITLRGFVDAPSYGIDIKSKLNDRHVSWKPNARTLTGVDFYIHGFIGAGIGVVAYFVLIVGFGAIFCLVTGKPFFRPKKTWFDDT